MLKKFNKLKLMDKILIVSGSSALLFFISYFVITKRPTQVFCIPPDFSGWVTIRYEKSGGIPLEQTPEGIMVRIPASGILETTDQLNEGWGRDVFYRCDGNLKAKIERGMSTPEGIKGWIHDKSTEIQKLDSILVSIPPFKDSVLWDGTRISRQDTTMDVKSGRKVLLHFYVSPDPVLIGVKIPELPEERKYW